jgi:hypothetical protein
MRQSRLILFTLTRMFCLYIAFGFDLSVAPWRFPSF